MVTFPKIVVGNEPWQRYSQSAGTLELWPGCGSCRLPCVVDVDHVFSMANVSVSATFH